MPTYSSDRCGPLCGARWIRAQARRVTFPTLLACALFTPAIQAQFWQQDPTFAPTLASPEIPIEHRIYDLARQPNGKVLATGYIERVNGQVRANPTAPMRFNADGSLDPSFQASESAFRLFPQPGGKIVTLNGLRLNADGTRDPTFQLAADLGTVEAVDALGRLYALRSGGTFVRTTTEGIVDGQFQSQVRPFYNNGIAPFADGSVAVAAVVEGVIEGLYYSTLKIVRLRPDGSQDPAFTPYVDTIQMHNFLGLVALPDGRVLLYGTVTAQYGVAMRFVRLGPDGLPDYIYVAPGSGSSAPGHEDAFTLAGVLYDLLQDAEVAPGTSIRENFSRGDCFVASLDVTADGSLWLADGTRSPPIVFGRYTRSSATALTIDPRPTVVYEYSPATIERVLGQDLLLIGPTAGGLFPLTYQWLKDGNPIPGATTTTLNLKGLTANDAGSYAVKISNAYGSVTSSSWRIEVDTTPAPVKVIQPVENRAVTVGAGLVWWTYATGNPFPTFAWTRNGSAVNIVTGGSGQQASSSVQINHVQPEHTGVYETTVTSGNSSQHMRAILGVLSDVKTSGAAVEVGADIVHPNKNVYDQVLLSGAAAAITADAGQVTRISFVDLTHDIVQVELSGAGTLALVLENSGPPAAPIHYNQPNVLYVRGHPGIVVAGADETTNVSVFSVGRANAVNQALFRDDVDYDGTADLAFIAITTTNGRFGSLRTGNVQYYAAKGLTGVYAPDVAFEGPVFVDDIDAFDNATPALVLKSAADLRVTGGDLLQTNGEPMLIGERVPNTFTAGTNSHGQTLPTQPNRAIFQPEETP